MGRVPLRILLSAALALALLGACAEDETEPGAGQQIALEAYDFYFEPTSFMFDLGARVTIGLSNAGESTHSFTIDELDIDVEAASGETTDITFQVPDEPGVFDFFCKYHPDEMNGTISMGGADEPIEEAPEEESEDGAGTGAYDY